MGEVTGIAWTDETINAVIGCEMISPGCDHCYAVTQTPARVLRAKGHETWGPRGERHETAGWVCALRRAHRKGLTSGAPVRVFAGSMSDPFLEDPTWERVRPWYFAALECATGARAQVLTKRPENILRMVPPSWLKSWPAHVQIGTTVEDQENAERRIPHLLRVPARVRFLSVEPQIGPVDLRRIQLRDDDAVSIAGLRVADRSALDAQRPWTLDALQDRARMGTGHTEGHGSVESRGASYWCRGISWVIQGGESGPRARPFDLAWARVLRDQCRAAGVAYFLKQLGARPTGFAEPPPDRDVRWLIRSWTLRDSHGGDESEWPADLRGCRAFPE